MGQTILASFLHQVLRYKCNSNGPLKQMVSFLGCSSDIPKGYSSQKLVSRKVSIFRRVIILRSFIPKVHYSEGSVFRISE